MSRLNRREKPQSPEMEKGILTRISESLPVISIKEAARKGLQMVVGTAFALGVADPSNAKADTQGHIWPDDQQVMWCGQWSGYYGGGSKVGRDIMFKSGPDCDKTANYDTASSIPGNKPLLFEHPTTGQVYLISENGNAYTGESHLRITRPDLSNYDTPQGTIDVTENGGKIKFVTKDGVILTGTSLYQLNDDCSGGEYKGRMDAAHPNYFGSWMLEQHTTGNGVVIQLTSTEKIKNHNPEEDGDHIYPTKKFIIPSGTMPNGEGCAIDHTLGMLYVAGGTGYFKIPLEGVTDPETGNLIDMQNLDFLTAGYMNANIEFVDLGAGSGISAARVKEISVSDDGTIFMAIGGLDLSLVIIKDGQTFNVPNVDDNGDSLMPFGVQVFNPASNGGMHSLGTLQGLTYSILLTPTNDPSEYMYPGVPYKRTFLGPHNNPNSDELIPFQNPDSDSPFDGDVHGCVFAWESLRIKVLNATADCGIPTDPCEGVECDDDGNPCTTVTCVDNEGSAACQTAILPDGTECEITDPNYLDTLCEDGQCKGTFICDTAANPYENEPCATATCVAENGTVGWDITYLEGADCDDTDPNTNNDTCSETGECEGTPACATATNPYEDEQCLTATCVSEDGQVSWDITYWDGIACDDNNYETEDDTCDDAGNCAGEFKCGVWKDPWFNDTCTKGFCDLQPPSYYPIWSPVSQDGLSCNDQDPNTLNDTCWDGECIGDDPCDVVLPPPTESDCTYNVCEGAQDGEAIWAEYMYEEGEECEDDDGEAGTCDDEGECYVVTVEENPESPAEYKEVVAPEPPIEDKEVTDEPTPENSEVLGEETEVVEIDNPEETDQPDSDNPDTTGDSQTDDGSGSETASETSAEKPKFEVVEIDPSEKGPEISFHQEADATFLPEATGADTTAEVEDDGSGGGSSGCSISSASAHEAAQNSKVNVPGVLLAAAFAGTLAGMRKRTGEGIRAFVKDLQVPFTVPAHTKTTPETAPHQAAAREAIHETYARI